ncbi:hypothetical protein GUJ93_ZPchr0007g5600 [Zizania palustris]|uniref:peroxidase n=1 Tax=Zizania palustris TaxID=103762 RepID=A0A8J5W649_ZIZPA|nr:hypothetical protein GUJ93_ZPchr0007g5600 [Zizania palustris]
MANLVVLTLLAALLGGGSSPSRPTTPPAAGLTVGYYDDRCPGAEDVVKNIVRYKDAGIKAGLVRLFFHDCFVEGCDASVLLDPTAANAEPEKLGIPNLSLRGFEVIDEAKAALEARCPGVVSCADIVAFAGRDASYFLSSHAIDFQMPAGRYDGRVSLKSATIPNLPPPFADVQQLNKNFADKGLDTVDMVVLSGAHSIGRSQCSSFGDRLPPSTSDMDPSLVASLQQQCRSSSDTVSQDLNTPDALDNQYYKNVMSHQVLFKSDAALMSAPDTMDLVRADAYFPELWNSRFGAAMVKMGNIGVKNSTNGGEIRKQCRFVNSI